MAGGERVEAIASLEVKRGRGKKRQCLAIFSTIAKDPEKIRFSRDFVLGAIYVGESLLRGCGAYQVEIMCSVPGNLAFFLSLSLSRPFFPLQPSRIYFFDCFAFAGNPEYSVVATCYRTETLIVRSSRAITATRARPLRHEIICAFVIYRKRYWRPDTNQDRDVRPFGSYVCLLVNKTKFITVSNRRGYLTHNGRTRGVKGSRLMFIICRDNEA